MEENKEQKFLIRLNILVKLKFIEISKGFFLNQNLFDLSIECGVAMR